MILNEDYFKDIEITDDDIESPDDIDISNNNEYATPEEWFADIKSKYTHCIDITLKREYQWKVNPKPIIKRMLYVFDVYGIEYSEPILQEIIHLEDNLKNGYSQCNFIDYNGYKLISSKHKTIESVKKSNNAISVVIFFNLPKVHSYKAACVFFSSIINCLSNDRIKYLRYDDFDVMDFNPISYNTYFPLNKNSIECDDIISIINLFFPEKSSTIRDELFADDNALLNKLLKCF